MGLGDRLRALFGGSGGLPVVRVALGHTLMRLDPELEVHVQSGTRPKTWYLDAPPEWDAPRIEQALHEIFARHNARFRENEPSDPNYLAMVEFKHTPVPFVPAGPYPWELDPRIVWEASSCWAVSPRLVPLLPTGFTNHLLMRALAARTLAPEKFRTIALPRFGSQASLVDKIIESPESYIALGLDMAASGAGWA